MVTRSVKTTRPKAPPDPEKLARVAAGRYATGDGRFAVDQASGGWMLTDADRTNELGLPLVRGPFETLEAARAALEALRSGPAPISDLAERIAAIPKQRSADGAAGRTGRAGRAGRAGGSPPPPKAPQVLPVIVREFRSRDGEGLRRLWEAAELRSLGDDEMSLRRFAQRNPGLFLVASQGSEIVGSAMGGWDGRRGWIYHVATSTAHRRAGLATKLVRQVEEAFVALGCPKVNVIVRDGNVAGAAFWTKLGYRLHDAHQFGRELASRDGGS